MIGQSLNHPMQEISFRAPGYQNMMFGRNLEQIGLHKADLWSSGARPALSFLLRYHAFARAGGEQAGYGNIAFSSIDALPLDEQGRIPGNELWGEFRDRCERRGIGVNERVNKGVIVGLSDLATREGNPFLWMEKEVESSGRLSPVYEELLDIKGIGRKIATFIIRDVIWFLGLEDDVVSEDLKFLQPIDRWVRRVGEQMIPGLTGMNRDAIATRLALECESRGISNAEFNQGAWYISRIEFGGELERLEAELQSGLKNQALA